MKLFAVLTLLAALAAAPLSAGASEFCWYTSGGPVCIVTPDGTPSVPHPTVVIPPGAELTPQATATPTAMPVSASSTPVTVSSPTIVVAPPTAITAPTASAERFGLANVRNIVSGQTLTGAASRMMQVYVDGGTWEATNYAIAINEQIGRLGDWRSLPRSKSGFIRAELCQLGLIQDCF